MSSLELYKYNSVPEVRWDKLTQEESNNLMFRKSNEESLNVEAE